MLREYINAAKGFEFFSLINSSLIILLDRSAERQQQQRREKRNYNSYTKLKEPFEERQISLILKSDQF